MSEFIPVIKARTSHKVKVADIFYIEQYLRKTKILTEEETHEVYSKIDRYLEYMGDNFLRCHRSLYVNMDNVISMKEQKIIFKNGVCVYLSRDKYTAARQHFSRYITSNKNLIFYAVLSCNITHCVV